jgi:hypothetical protein
MTIPKALITIVSCILLFAAGGLAIGALIGAISPEYYGTIFERAKEVGPVRFGLGIGLAQGATFGFFAGIVAVLAVTWYRVRSATQSRDRDRKGGERRNRRRRERSAESE